MVSFVLYVLLLGDFSTQMNHLKVTFCESYYEWMNETFICSKGKNDNEKKNKLMSSVPQVFHSYYFLFFIYFFRSSCIAIRKSQISRQMSKHRKRNTEFQYWMKLDKFYRWLIATLYSNWGSIPTYLACVNLSHICEPSKNVDSLNNMSKRQ